MRASVSPVRLASLLTTSLLTAPLLALACAPPETTPKDPLPFAPAGPAAAPDPSTYGPYAVGVRTMTFLDDERETPGKDGPRKLVAEVWYPAAGSARDDEKQDYVIYDELPESLRAGLTPEDLGRIETEAVRDAPVYEDVRFPVIIFSHGKGGLRQQSTFYTVPLASHGYVVVAPDHEGDTIVELLEAGDVDVTSTVDSYLLRPGDVSFLLSELEALGDDPLTPILNLEKVGVTGHSFGALTSFRAAGSDLRVDAIVAHTPVGITLVEAELEATVDEFGIPYLIAAAGLDRTLPKEIHADSVWQKMVPPRFYLSLATAGHFTYSDLCVLDVEAIDAALDVDASNVLTDGCGEENIPPALAFPAINLYSIGFFNTYLRGSPASLAFLDEEHGRAIAGDEVTFLAEPE